MEKEKLAQIEEYILEFFRQQGKNKVSTRAIFGSTSMYANSDLVRAFEDLEKNWRLLIRYTEEGEDWIHLTLEGTRYLGPTQVDGAEPPEVIPHPPKSSP